MLLERYTNEFRALSVTQLVEIRDELNKIIDRSKVEELKKLKREFEENIGKLGVHPSEIYAGATKKQSGSRKSVKPKYRMVTSDGTVHEWSGRGITPHAFKNFSKEQLDDRYRI